MQQKNDTYSEKMGEFMTTATQTTSSTEETKQDPQKTEAKKKRKSLPSFMKTAFAGGIDQKLIFPFPKPSDEEMEEMDSFLQEVDKFWAENVNAIEIDENGKIPEKLLKDFAEFGMFSLTAPEEYDGLGISNTFFSRFMGVIARHCASVCVTFGAHLSIGSKGLYLFGTEEQKAKYVPNIASGKTIAAFCLTEPQAGSDAHSIRTTAKLTEDGKHYVLNGEKIYITNGAFADFFTVFAKIASDNEEESGFTAFIVTRDMGGISCGKEEKKLGLKGSSTTPVIFTDVKVPVENILGEKGKGFKIAMEILNLGRLGLAAACAGGVRRLIEQSIIQASQRKQFGFTLSSFGLIQKKLARMTALNFAMNSAVLLAAGMADSKEVDFSIESAICKVFATESTWEIINETVQIFGGNGFIADFELERALRDCRVNMIFEGTNEILKLFIALTGMKDIGNYLKNVGKAFNKPLQSIDVIVEYLSTKAIRSIAKEKFDNVSICLHTETKLVEKYISLLNHVVEKRIRMYKKDIIHQQLFLERIANMSIYIYVLAACISRVDTQLKNGKTEEQLKHDLECVHMFGQIAQEQLEQNYDGITSNYDETIKAISDYVCEKQQYPFKVW